MDVLSWDGTLSPHDFYVAARSFAEEWRRFSSVLPPWTWVPCAERVGHVDGYLTLEKLCVNGSSEKCVSSQEEIYMETDSETENGKLVEEPFDSATLVESSSSEVHFFDFHIVYSATYRVPVLYFRAYGIDPVPAVVKVFFLEYHIDGQPLVLDELKGLPACSEKLLLESKWTFITQEEHPHLNRPWYKLHPCGTSEWMKLLFNSDASLARKGVVVELYLVSWLSVVGKVVGLTIPFELLNRLKHRG